MAVRLCSLVTALVLATGGGASAAASFASLAPLLASLDLDRGTELVNSRVGKTYRSLYKTCDSADTFNGALLPRFNGRRLKCSTDPNHVDFIRKFPDGTIVFRSKMGVDADGSPVSQSPNASAADQPHTSLHYDTGTADYVNAEDVSFVVVPQSKASYRAAFKADSGIGLGDLAVVIKGGKCSFGLVADEGPAYRIGEASMKAHEDLGNPQCKVPGEYPCKRLKAGGNGVGIAAGVTYIIFPNSRPSSLKGSSVSSLTARLGSEKAAEFLAKYRK